MRRVGLICLLMALLAGTLLAPADAAKNKPKKVTRPAEATYGFPATGSPSTTGLCFNLGGPRSCPEFPIYATEKWVTMEVIDAAGSAPVALSIWQNPDGDDSGEEIGGPFCGFSGKQPVKITPGVDVSVVVYASGDVLCPGAFATEGTVKAVFSNAP